MTDAEENDLRALWFNTAGKAQKCCDVIDSLIRTYGELAAAIAVVIYYENLPGNTMLMTERLRYINTKLKNEGSGKLKGFFSNVERTPPFTEDEYKKKKIITGD